MKNYPVYTTELSTGETIAYRHTGNGEKTIVLVHGNMSSSVHYQIVMEQLENEYNVYAIDLRGFGDSSFNNEINSLHDFSKDVSAFITEMKLGNVSLVGWSTGGGIILETAADLPELVDKIVLLDSVGIQGYPMFKKDEKGQPILSEFLTEKEDIAKDAVQVVPILEAYRTRNKDLLRLIWDASIYHIKKPSEEDYDEYLKAMLKQRNLVDVDYSLVHFNITNKFNGINEGTNRAAEIKAKIAVFHGEKDLVVPLDYSRFTKDYFQEQAELIVFENCGHSVITDDLEAFIKELKKFID